MKRMGKSDTSDRIIPSCSWCVGVCGFNEFMRQRLINENVGDLSTQQIGIAVLRCRCSKENFYRSSDVGAGTNGKMVLKM